MSKLSYARSMQNLIKEFSKMPGIGTRTAERLAFYILKLPQEDAERLSQSILKVKATIRFCKICNNLSEGDLCPVCQDEGRDKGKVEELAGDGRRPALYLGEELGELCQFKPGHGQGGGLVAHPGAKVPGDNENEAERLEYE